MEKARQKMPVSTLAPGVVLQGLIANAPETFREELWSDVGEWLTHVRMHEALIALTEAESIKEVAFQLGYSQLSNFSRDFKKFHGFCPGTVSFSRMPLCERISILTERENRGEHRLGI